MLKVRFPCEAWYRIRRLNPRARGATAPVAVSYTHLGASKGQLRALIGGEVAAIVGAGLVSGLACGAGLYVVLMDLLQDGSAFPFISPDPGETGALAAVLAAAFALLALAAIAAPLAQIGRLDPSLAMQQGDID